MAHDQVLCRLVLSVMKEWSLTSVGFSPILQRLILVQVRLSSLFALASASSAVGSR